MWHDDYDCVTFDEVFNILTKLVRNDELTVTGEGENFI